jgi:hypothetical protein
VCRARALADPRGTPARSKPSANHYSTSTISSHPTIDDGETSVETGACEMRPFLAQVYFSHRSL